MLSEGLDFNTHAIEQSITRTLKRDASIIPKAESQTSNDDATR